MLTVAVNNFHPTTTTDSSKSFESSASSFQLDCKNAVGYLAVYRFCFIVTLFFGLFSGQFMEKGNSKEIPLHNFALHKIRQSIRGQNPFV